MDIDQTEMERIRKKRLELLFNDPNIKIEDIVVAVGDKEIEEEIKNLTELKNKMEDEVQQCRTMKEMTEEVEKLHEEFDQIMADMQEIRNVQVEEQGGDKLLYIRKMIDAISAEVEVNEKKQSQLNEDIEKAVETEKKLKEDLHIAKNEQAIRNESNNKRGINWNGRGSNGGVQRNYNNNMNRRSRM